MTINQQFLIARRAAGLTQTEAGKRMNVSRGFISSFENGYSNISPEYLIKVKKFIREQEKEKKIKELIKNFNKIKQL
jgi:transcriptional regulator with XRE-family HTH domain